MDRKRTVSNEMVGEQNPTPNQNTNIFYQQNINVTTNINQHIHQTVQKEEPKPKFDFHKWVKTAYTLLKMFFFFAIVFFPITCN